MGRNRVSERASFFGKIYRRERYPKEMIYISRWNNPHQWSFVMHLLLFPLCASSWRDFRRYLLLYVVASEETHYFQNKPCLPSTIRYCSIYAGCHFTHQTDTFPVCSIGNKLPISIIFWLVDQRKKIIWSTLEYTYVPMCFKIIC